MDETGFMARVMTKRIKRFLLFGVCLVALLAIGAYLLPYYISGEDMVFSNDPASPGPSKESLKVMTLNLAHGRKDGVNQIFQGENRIRSNLDDVVRVLQREKPDVVALQEADGPSIWSGGFDHVAYLAEKAEFPSHMRGEHVKGLKLSYGTALLSRYPLKDPLSYTFPVSPPTPPKGFVICTVPWPGNRETEVDIVSVHFDFLRSSVRKKQAEKLISELESRNKPLILLGDFNCEVKKEGSALGLILEKLGLAAYKPDAKGMDTFPFTHNRFDWILLSSEFEFTSYDVLSDVLSDHLGVIAVVRMK